MTIATFTNSLHSRELALVVPTKDRPEKLSELLSSIADQTIRCGKVIIVDGSTSAETVANGFKDKLPIAYYQSRIPGQIHQRNLGIARLTEHDRLIGFIDDDMELEPDCLENVLRLWNAADPEPAGVGLNLVHGPSSGGKLFKKIFLLDGEIPGQVLKSGANTSINDIQNSTRTQWLGGGYTIWRKDVILRHPHLAVKTKWAIGEDLRFSYPIGKQYPLWVCADARAKHNHIYRKDDLIQFADYRGYKIAMASLFFVRSNEELSLPACYWMLVGLCLSRLARGIVKKQQRYLLWETFGMLKGILRSVAAGADRNYILSQMED